MKNEIIHIHIETWRLEDKKINKKKHLKYLLYQIAN